jgi:hypothetical protein
MSHSESTFEFRAAPNASSKSIPISHSSSSRRWGGYNDMILNLQHFNNLPIPPYNQAQLLFFTIPSFFEESVS